MKTMDRILEESGIRRIKKLTDNFDYSKRDYGDDIKRLDDSDINRIVKLIDDCYYAISNEDASDSTLKNLADALRKLFESDCCTIGKVDGGFIEVCIDSWVNTKKENYYRIQKRNLKDVKRVRLDNQYSYIIRGLNSNGSFTYFDEEEIKKTESQCIYETILGVIRNITIIPIRNKNNTNKGFIQIINSKCKIVSYDFKPLNESLLKLILLIHQQDELKDAQLFQKDSDFLSKAQEKLDNVDLLLEDIMQYLSKEFSAGVVSYRIPLLVGIDKKPLFFLRECYIKDEIAQYYNREDYFRDRLIRTVDQMGGYDKLNCKNNQPVIIDEAKDSVYYNKIFNEKISFRKDTLIIPVLRDYSEKDECVHPQKHNGFSCDDEINCPFRFAKYFGVFKLRILKASGALDDEEASEWITENTMKRLSNLATHISILLNVVVEKQENRSLDVFQKELKGTSFTKIKEFDEQCSIIVKKSIHAKICAIYRYNTLNNKLIFSASTLPSEINSRYIHSDINEMIEQYGDAFCLPVHKLEEELSNSKTPIYFTNGTNGRLNSIMLVPMIRKDNSKLGVILLVGKEDNRNWNNLSKTFWEHDKKNIEFIVEVLTRIEESDSERLTFLSQLSHELLRPLTEMVYRNGYFVATAKKNSNAYTKEKLINELQKNVDRCMMLKYIIEDVEYIYSLSKGDVLYNYNFEMTDIKDIILDAIRLSEEEAYSKGLTIKSYLDKMPKEFFIDRSRMMQVVINLLSNAIKYSNNYEDISIRYEFDKEKDCHEISFEDMGIPVDSDDKERIFDLYYRGKNAFEKVPNGSGVGLYLVKQIMNAHRGDCFVKKLSCPTTFTIQIPNKK